MCTRALLPDLFSSVFTVGYVITPLYTQVNVLWGINKNYPNQIAVVSAKFKSSTSTMVYVAGIFQFAPAINPN
jgi:hypothetical protein